MSSDQRSHWDKIHGAGNIKTYSDKPTSFAQEVETYLQGKKTLLELGCGSGNDSIYFAQNGLNVTATDFSSKAIEEDTERYKDATSLKFHKMDSRDLESLNSAVDVIYARLSLHYFTDLETKKIFKAIYSKLNPNGLLCFVCKSTKDPLYAQGNKVEDNMYDLDGHVRHFFSEEYARECLGDDFEIIKIESGDEEFYGQNSGFVKVIARKK